MTLRCADVAGQVIVLAVAGGFMLPAILNVRAENAGTRRAATTQQVPKFDPVYAKWTYFNTGLGRWAARTMPRTITWSAVAWVT